MIDRAVPDCLVSDYELLEAAIALPDKDDRHILAAAIKAQAGVIVTFNLDDFPAAATRKHGVEAQHPDDFVTHLIDLSPAAVYSTIKQHRESLRNPQKSAAEYIETLMKCQLVETAMRIEEYAHLI